MTLCGWQVIAACGRKSPAERLARSASVYSPDIPSNRDFQSQSEEMLSLNAHSHALGLSF
jgi:hypothetical protein